MNLIDFSKPSYLRDLYKQCKEFYWVPETVNLSTDKLQWATVPADIKEQVLNLLQYAIFLDSFQVSNISGFIKPDDDPMLQAVLSYHSLMESIHSQSYTYWAESVCTSEEVEWLYNGEKTKERADLFLKVKEEYGDLEANFFLEAVSFQALFRLADVLKKKSILPGFSNILTLIKRDEEIHIVTFRYLLKQQKENKLKEAFLYAVPLEAENIFQLTKNEDFRQYIYYIGSKQHWSVFNESLWPKVQNPFKDIKKINDSTKNKVKANFFTTNVLYEQLDESLDWNVDNWFS